MSTSKHFISRGKVKQLTSHYTKNKNKILKDEFHDKATLPVCETFERTAFDQLLAQPGCVGIRIYFGMDDGLDIKLIVVGVNDKDEDMLTLTSDLNTLKNTDIINTPVIALADATRCPPDCPPPPPPDPPTD